MTEEEQVEQLKKWWRKYGNIALTILLAVVIAIQGYRWYQEHLLSVKTDASIAFNSLMDAVSKEDTKSSQAKANYIKEQYPTTVYATSAALVLAKQAIDAEKYVDAEKELQWVIAKTESSSFKQLAKLRLARVYAYQKNYQQALTLLDPIEEQLFAPLVYETKGDIYYAEGMKDKAAEQYQQAAAKLPNPALVSKELRVKMSQVSNQHSQWVNQTMPLSQPQQS